MMGSPFAKKISTMLSLEVPNRWIEKKKRLRRTENKDYHAPRHNSSDTLM